MTKHITTSSNARNRPERKNVKGACRLALMRVRNQVRYRLLHLRKCSITIKHGLRICHALQNTLRHFPRAECNSTFHFRHVAGKLSEFHYPREICIMRGWCCLLKCAVPLGRIW